MERSNSSAKTAEVAAQDMDHGPYKDRESDADTGARLEVHPWQADRESVLRELVMLGHSMSSHGQHLLEEGARVRNQALHELRDFNVEEKDHG